MLDVILLFIACTLTYMWYRDNYTRSNGAPGPPKFPIIGNIPQLILTGEILPYVAFDKLSKKYGPIMSIKMGVIDMVVLTSMEDMNELLTKEETLDRFPFEMMKDRNGDDKLQYGIIFCNGAPWKAVRRFSIQNLRQFGFGKKQSMEGAMLGEAKELIKRTYEEASQNGGIVQVDLLYFTLSVINALWTMVAGTRFSHDNPRLKYLIKLNSDLQNATTFVGDISMAFPIIRKVFPWITNKPLIVKIFNEIKTFAKEIHDEHKARNNYEQNPESFVDIFLAKIDEEKILPEDERIFTEDQFCYVLSELFQVGSETMNGSLSYSILFMILNPEVQRKVQEEIDLVVPLGVDVSLGDKPRLIYTQAVIQEVLRFGVIVPLSPPRLFTKDVDYKGYSFKKGTPIFPNYYSVAMSQSSWGDPHVFRPERFLTSDGKALANLQKHSPFGFGKRYCMGESLATPALFLYFVMMLRNFELSTVPGEPKPSIKPQPSITTTPYSFKIVVKARKCFKYDDELKE